MFKHINLRKNKELSDLSSSDAASFIHGSKLIDDRGWLTRRVPSHLVFAPSLALVLSWLFNLFIKGKLIQHHIPLLKIMLYSA